MGVAQRHEVVERLVDAVERMPTAPRSALTGIAVAATEAGTAWLLGRACDGKGDHRRRALVALGYCADPQALALLEEVALADVGLDAEAALGGLRIKNDRSIAKAVFARLLPMGPPSSAKERRYQAAAYELAFALDPCLPEATPVIARLIAAPLGQDESGATVFFQNVLKGVTRSQRAELPILKALCDVTQRGEGDPRALSASVALAVLTGEAERWLPAVLSAACSPDARTRARAETSLSLLGLAELPALRRLVAARLDPIERRHLERALRNVTTRQCAAGRIAKPSDQESYHRIEQELGVALPSLHRRLYEAGLLTHHGARTIDSRSQSMVDHPTVLANDPEFVAWHSPSDILLAYQPAYWKLDPPLVEIACNGSGDSICYRPDWARGEEIPVIEAWHDCNEAVCLAPHLEGFIFRRLLEACSQLLPAEWRSLDDQVASLRAEVAQLEGYLRPGWLGLLREVVGRPLRARQSVLKDALYCLVSEEEATRTVTQELHFDHLGVVFEHMD